MLDEKLAKQLPLANLTLGCMQNALYFRLYLESIQKIQKNLEYANLKKKLWKYVLVAKRQVHRYCILLKRISPIVKARRLKYS